MSAPDRWPPIVDEHLVALWRLPSDQLYDHIGDFFARVIERLGPRTVGVNSEAPYSYPFGRTDEVTLLDGDASSTVDAATAQEFAEGRIPLLAFGANGSPSRLALKLAPLEDRQALLSPALVDGIDVCALPMPAGYGSFAGGIAESPGTTVQAVLLDLSPEQFEWISMTEFGYHVGRLTNAVVRTADGREIAEPLGYVQRFGLYDVGGHPAPLAAIGATGRRWPAWSQQDLFAHCAGRLGIPGGDPEALLASITADPTTWMLTHGRELASTALTGFEPAFEPHPAGLA